MHLNPSSILTGPRVGRLHAAKIQPPAFLSHDLCRDWEVISTSYPNLMLVGSSSATSAILHVLEPHFRKPICRFKPKADVVLPEPTEGTLIVSDVDGLDSNQQAQMLRWVNHPQTRVQVVSTSREPMFYLVEAGDFLTELYYRLNVVLLDVTPF